MNFSTRILATAMGVAIRVDAGLRLVLRERPSPLLTAICGSELREELELGARRLSTHFAGFARPRAPRACRYGTL